MTDFIEQSSVTNLPRIIEIRTGKCLAPEVYKEKLGKDGWPTDIPSAFWKQNCEEVEVTLEGLKGNEIGHPSHLNDAYYRAALVYNQMNNELYRLHFPDHEIHAGDFGENFLVNHPSLLSTEVCIGDQYQIGSAIFEVTGPRMPCPKVDAAQQLKGIQKIGLENGWTGFFFKVIQPGAIKVGDEIRLLVRPNPGFTISRIASGIWGPPEKQDYSREFLEALANMEALMPRGYRDTAKTRLARLNEQK